WLAEAESRWKGLGRLRLPLPSGGSSLGGPASPPHSQLARASEATARRKSDESRTLPRGGHPARWREEDRLLRARGAGLSRRWAPARRCERLRAPRGAAGGYGRLPEVPVARRDLQQGRRAQVRWPGPAGRPADVPADARGGRRPVLYVAGVSAGPRVPSDAAGCAGAAGSSAAAPHSARAASRRRGDERWRGAAFSSAEAKPRRL